MELVEQIARALAEAEHGEDAWEYLYLPHGRYLALARVVLPFIAAERERCAVIADKRQRDAEGSYEILEKMENADDGSLALLAGDAQASASIAAAIRSQP